MKYIVNILHLKYAVEVGKTRSISKAAENLFMGQPNLSRAIKELEESLGIDIFKRTSKGIDITPEGEEFLQYAKNILRQIDEVEQMYKGENAVKQKFSISVPRAGYISCAFAEFAKNIDMARPAEIFYKETNTSRAIKNILTSDYKLGIIRYQKVFEPYFEALLRDKGLEGKLVWEFSYVAAMSEKNPLAKKEFFSLNELSDYIEIAHADPYVPSLPLVDVKKAELSESVNKRIYVFERGSQLDLLSTVPSTFMWVSPVPEHIKKLYGIVERQSPENKKIYRDVLIYRKGYTLTPLDNAFMDNVYKIINNL